MYSASNRYSNNESARTPRKVSANALDPFHSRVGLVSKADTTNLVSEIEKKRKKGAKARD